jgi:hypothetical protein
MAQCRCSKHALGQLQPRPHHGGRGAPAISTIADTKKIADHRRPSRRACRYGGAIPITPFITIKVLIDFLSN